MDDLSPIAAEVKSIAAEVKSIAAEVKSIALKLSIGCETKFESNQ